MNNVHEYMYMHTLYIYPPPCLLRHAVRVVLTAVCLLDL